MKGGKKSELLERILLNLKNMNGVKELALSSRDGFFYGGDESDEIETLTNMSANMMRAAEIINNKLDRSGHMHVIVDFGGEKLIAASAGPKAMISVIAQQDASIDHIMNEINNTASKIQKIL